MTFVASDETRDSYGTVLPVSEWNLERYNNNGIVGYAHNLYGSYDADPDYVIGRVDGDVFNVVIPMPADDEAEEYIDRVRRRMDAFEDEHIAPSVAIGLNYKSNVENTMEDALSDAEYAMFENKIEVKNAPGYLDRLHKE